MNKILNVNLGGYALTIDDDAYEYLHRYLEAIRARFSASEGRDEIIGDIESRMGELLHQKLNNRTICTLTDVQNVVKVMGKPEDFGGDATASAGSGSGYSGSTGSGYNTFNGSRTGRRFYRDEEDKVVGGVCSGLAAYLGITDPVWLRLGFVALFFISAGFWFIAYIVIMVVVPAARTSADRLAMRGEPINVDNIAKEVETTFERISNSVSNFGEDLKKKSNGSGSGIKSAISSVLRFFGRIIVGLIRALGSLTKGVAFLIVGCLVFALLISWLAGFWSFFELQPYLHYFSPLSEGGNYSVMISSLFFIGLPVVSVFVGLLSSIFKTKSPRLFQGGLWTVWSIFLVALIFFAASISKAFKGRGVATTELSMSPSVSDTLFVQWADQDLKQYNFRSFEGEFSFNNDDSRYTMDEKSLLIGDEALAINLIPEVRIAKAISSQFEIATEVHARGRSAREANESAEAAGFRCDLVGNVLYVPKASIVPKGQKLRTFDFNLNIKVPVGKFIVMREGIHANVERADMNEAKNNRNRFYKNPNKVFQMTSDGLVCITCDGYGKGKFSSDEEYRSFSIEGPFDVDFTQDGNDFELDMNGANDKDINFTYEGDKVILVNNTGQTRKIRIRCDEITNLELMRGAKANVFGFENHEATLTLEDNCLLTGKVDISNLQIRLRKNSKVDLMGDCGNLNLSLEENSQALLFNLKSDVVSVRAKENCNAEVFAEGESNVLSDETSKVKVSGNADKNKTERI
jgi:phage shock protein PspC (stress-responsive transcriptional regulator)